MLRMQHLVASLQGKKKKEKEIAQWGALVCFQLLTPKFRQVKS